MSDEQIIRYVKRGVGIRGMADLLEISPTTVITRIKLIAKKIKQPSPMPFGKEYEIDEMSSFIRHKKKRVWITYALEKQSKKVVDFVVGSRSKKTMSKVTNTVSLSNPKQVFTDKYPVYLKLLPEEIHTVRRRCTNYIERKNLSLRTHLKRLNRKTICYSKSISMLTACLTIYFWG